jgi:diacylglycerol O-acyltransferase
MPNALVGLPHYRLTAQDASFIYNESQNGPLHIGWLIFFEDEFTLDELTRHLESKLHLLGRFRQRLFPVPYGLNHPTLEDDPDFKIENHIKLHRLPQDGGEADLIKAAMAVFQKPMDRNRPLWEMHLFNGFEGNRSVLMWTIHHCLIDGVSGTELLTVVMDFQPDPPPTEPPPEARSPKPLPTPFRQFTDAALDLAQAQLDSARRASQTAFDSQSVASDDAAIAAMRTRLTQQMQRPIAATPWSAGFVTQARTLAWLRVPFTDIRMVRSAFGGTVNDVVLAMLSEAAARYLRLHDVKPDAPFRVGCPVNVRRENESGTLGNRVSMMFPEVPADPIDPVARLKLVTTETLRIKQAAEPQVLERLMSSGDVVQPALTAMLSAAMTSAMDAAVLLSRTAPQTAWMLKPPASGISFIATNVPGPQVPLYLAGHPIVDYFGLLPLGGSLGFGVPIVSYNQNLYFTMMAEPNLMPDPELMKSLVEQVFEELKRAAAVTQTQTAQAAAHHAAIQAMRESAEKEKTLRPSRHSEAGAAA